MKSKNYYPFHFFKKASLFLVSSGILLISSSCSKTEDSVAPVKNETSAAVYNMSDAKVFAKSLKGVNNCPSYDGDNRTNIPLFGKQAYNTVRIEFDPSKVQYYTHDELWDDVNKYLNETSPALNVIVTWHNQDYMGGSMKNANGPVDAFNIFWDNAIKNRILKMPDASRRNRIVINILNEWGLENGQGDTWARYNNEAIAKIRGLGYQGRIIVDAGRWGNWVDNFLSHGHLITDPGVIFGVHIYENSGLTTAKINDINAKGRPMILGEFGLRWWALKTNGKVWSNLNNTRSMQDNSTNSPGLETFITNNNSLLRNFSTSEFDAEKATISTLANHCLSLEWGMLGWCWRGDGEGMSIHTNTSYRAFINGLIY